VVQDEGGEVPPTAPAQEAPGPADPTAEASPESDGSDLLLGSAKTEDAGASRGASARIRPGTHVGRFVVLERVGAGGMGEVYAAYDPDLDRKVALKVLRGDTAGPDDLGQERLRREARTMARLVDRHLVTVHDVGVHQGRVFVAMEFIDGSTLRAWQRERPWDEILAAYLDAGRGLAVAHAAGVVHRDFKPDNVLVSRDGRVAVTDFGLARTPGAESDDDGRSAGTSSDLRLTSTGALVGTPRYMAPEQYAGVTSDARTDQFNFCVALWEGLYGEHPLASLDSGFQQLRAPVLAGEVRPPPAGKVPPQVARALTRGLAVDPGQRWPDLPTLLAELDVLRRPRRRGWIALGAAVAVAAGGVSFGVWRAGHRDPAAEVCQGSEGLLDGVWDPARRAELQVAFAATHVPYARTTFDGLSRGLDAWRAGWIDARTRACRANRVYRETSEATLDTAMRCFDDQRIKVRTLVGMFAAITPDRVGNAARAIDQLPRPSRCTDAGALAAKVPLPKDPRAAGLVRAVETQVAAAEAARIAGDSHGARVRLGAASVAAAAAGYAPLDARIDLDLGLCEIDLGNLHAAAGRLERATQRSDEAADDGLRAEACAMEAEVAYFLSQYDDARRWLDRAEAVQRRSGTTDHERARVVELRGLVDVETDPPAAVPELRQAVAILQRDGATPGVVQAVTALAGAEAAAGEDAAADADFRRALATARAALGSSHPLVSKVLTNYGAFLLEHDRLDEARPLFQESLSIKQAVYGADDPNLGFPIQNLAIIARRTGHWDQAETMYARALALFEQRDQTAYAVPDALSGLAFVRMHQDRPAEAIPLLERAIAMRAREPRRELSDGVNELQLARALWSAGRSHDDARRHGLAARAIFEKLGDVGRVQLSETDRWLADPGHFVPAPGSPF